MFSLLRRLRARLKYRHHERDLAQELEIHRAMAQQDLEARGFSSADASPAAARALGNTTLMREEARSVWIARWLETTWQDVRYAVRGLRRQPMFAVTAVSILGLTAGLLTTVVLFADATMLQPWRVDNPDGLRIIRTTGRTADGFGEMRVPEFLTLRTQIKSWIGIEAAARMGKASVTFEDGLSTQVMALGVSAGYFKTLGVALAAGRTFSAEEENFTSPGRVAIVSHRLWKTYLQGDPLAVGKQFRLNNDMYTLIGVAPSGFIDGFGSTREVWIPFSMWLGRGTPEGRQAFLQAKHDNTSIEFFGRLAGNGPAAAEAELAQLSAAYRQAAGIDRTRFGVFDTRPISRPGNRGGFWTLVMLATALLLVQLLACANVGNMLLARSVERRREIAVRLSLGAGKRRIVRQLLVESGVLVVLAVVVAFTIAMVTPTVVWAFVPEWDERPEFYRLSLTTLLAVIAIFALSTLVAGLAPALRATRVALSAAAGDRHGPSRDNVRLRRFLLATQIAIATILLSGAGLLTRSVSNATTMDAGFPLEAYQEVAVTFPSAASSAERRAAFYRELLARTQGPDWPALTLADTTPIFDFSFSRTLRRAGPHGDQLFEVPVRGVSNNYFDVLGLRILAGRMPVQGAPVRELALNARAAALLWPGESPLGRTLKIGDRVSELVEVVVVGVVPDLPTTAINVLEPVAYTRSRMYSSLVIVRSTGADVLARLATLADGIEPGTTLSSRSLTEMLDDSLLESRISGWVAGGIGLFALGLAMIGAFGVFAYAVEARRRELGIRLALGARASQVIALVFRTTQSSVAWGLGIGITISAAIAPFFRTQLLGLSPLDPLSYLQVVAVLGSAAALATWIPARRATRVNPADILRSE